MRAVIKKQMGEVAQTMYIHVSKCKNDKIKGEKKKTDKRFYKNWCLEEGSM
jgi:hypothetical protein